MLNSSSKKRSWIGSVDHLSIQCFLVLQYNVRCLSDVAILADNISPGDNMLCLSIEYSVRYLSTDTHALENCLEALT